MKKFTVHLTKGSQSIKVIVEALNSHDARVKTSSIYADWKINLIS